MAKKNENEPPVFAQQPVFPGQQMIGQGPGQFPQGPFPPGQFPVTEEKKDRFKKRPIRFLFLFFLIGLSLLATRGLLEVWLPIDGDLERWYGFLRAHGVLIWVTVILVVLLSIYQFMRWVAEQKDNKKTARLARAFNYKKMRRSSRVSLIAFSVFTILLAGADYYVNYDIGTAFRELADTEWVGEYVDDAGRSLFNTDDTQAIAPALRDQADSIIDYLKEKVRYNKVFVLKVWGIALILFLTSLIWYIRLRDSERTIRELYLQSVAASKGSEKGAFDLVKGKKIENPIVLVKGKKGLYGSVDK